MSKRLEATEAIWARAEEIAAEGEWEPDALEQADRAARDRRQMRRQLPARERSGPWTEAEWAEGKPYRAELEKRLAPNWTKRTRLSDYSRGLWEAYLLARWELEELRRETLAAEASAEAAGLSPVEYRARRAIAVLITQPLGSGQAYAVAATCVAQWADGLQSTEALADSLEQLIAERERGMQ